MEVESRDVIDIARHRPLDRRPRLCYRARRRRTRNMQVQIDVDVPACAYAQTSRGVVMRNVQPKNSCPLAPDMPPLLLSRLSHRRPATSHLLVLRQVET